VPWLAHHGIAFSAAARLISENGGCSESTGRIASQRASRCASKFETPIAHLSLLDEL
jgi:hypothetical protein